MVGYKAAPSGLIFFAYFCPLKKCYAHFMDKRGVRDDLNSVSSWPYIHPEVSVK